MCRRKDTLLENVFFSIGSVSTCNNKNTVATLTESAGIATYYITHKYRLRKEEENLNDSVRKVLPYFSHCYGMKIINS